MNSVAASDATGSRAAQRQEALPATALSRLVSRLVSRLARVPAVGWRGVAALVLGGFALASIVLNSAVVDSVRYFWLDDDQMISMRYARNLADGLGPVWNAGERVEGYTNFLWMTVMAAVHLLPLSDAHTSLVVKGIAAALAFFVLLQAEQLLRTFRPVPGFALPLAFLALALCPDVLYWSLHGFETTLLTAIFVFVVARLFAESRSGLPRRLTYAAMSLLPLVRSDAHLLWGTAALLAFALSRDRRQTCLWLVVAGLPTVAHEAFRLAYYGEWFPNTYTLKVVGNDLGERFVAGRRYVATFLITYWIVVLLACIGAVRARDLGRGALLAGASLVLLYCVWTGGDLWPGARFLAPLVPVLVVLAIVAAAEVGGSSAREGGGEGSRESAAGLVLMLCVAIVAGVVPLVQTARNSDSEFLVTENGGPKGSLLAAIAIRENTSPNAKVAVHGAGIVPYFSRRPSIDWLGKADATIARGAVRSDRVGHNKYDPEHSLGRLGADLAVMLWLPENLGSCSPRAKRIAEQVAPDWVSAVYLSDVFQREFCNHVVEYYTAPPIYVRNSSPEAAGLAHWREPLMTPD